MHHHPHPNISSCIRLFLLPLTPTHSTLHSPSFPSSLFLPLSYMYLSSLLILPLHLHPRPPYSPSFLSLIPPLLNIISSSPSFFIPPFSFLIPRTSPLILPPLPSSFSSVFLLFLLLHPPPPNSSLSSSSIFGLILVAR